MKYRHPALATLSVALVLAFASPVIAQDRTPTAEQQKQLDAARVELDAAAKRFADLARQYGLEQGPMHIEQRLLRKPMIGVLLAPDPQSGVSIAGVTPDGAAAAAGLRSGDRLLSIDGKAITGGDGKVRLDNARSILAAHDDNSQVRLAYVRDGRQATVVVTPKAGDNLFFLPGMLDDDSHNMQFVLKRGGSAEVAPGRMQGLSPSIAPDIRREIIRIGPGRDCKDGHCSAPMLAEALRWSGLNLATVDAQLGHYFGTDHGVLVLSSGPELAGLQAGDVIRSIDGKPVASPRAAMDALRGHASGSRVAIDYLRDRKPATTQVVVPEPMRFPMPMPPAPPMPPHPGDAMAPAGSGPVVVGKRRVVIVDGDGQTRTWEDDDAPPVPPPPPVE
jgi:membrane-associated protease RseP (regulator of RpoE activity)